MSPRNWRARYLTIEEFNAWRSNDFCHVVTAVNKIKGAVNIMRGTLIVLVPLILAILGLVGGLYLLLINKL